MLNLTRAIKTVALTALLSSLTVTAAAAQDRDADDRKYVVGIRSALITGTMPLSGLDPAFGDLAADGPEGPHMSGFYFMMKVRRHLRVGVETLVSEPRITSHASLTAEQRSEAGIPDGFLRFSLGLEDADDLIADIAQALASI